MAIKTKIKKSFKLNCKIYSSGLIKKERVECLILIIAEIAENDVKILL